jgi:hypothetical protein
MVPSFPESGADTNLTMRKMVIKSVVDSEHQYIAFLSILITVQIRLFIASRTVLVFLLHFPSFFITLFCLQYEKALRAGVSTAQQILANEDINVIFFRISDICTMHTDFVGELKPVLENWTPSQSIGLHFKMLVG